MNHREAQQSIRASSTSLSPEILVKMHPSTCTSSVADEHAQHSQASCSDMDIDDDVEVGQEARVCAKEENKVKSSGWACKAGGAWNVIGGSLAESGFSKAEKTEVRETLNCPTSDSYWAKFSDELLNSQNNLPIDESKSQKSEKEIAFPEGKTSGESLVSGKDSKDLSATLQNKHKFIHSDSKSQRCDVEIVSSATAYSSNVAGERCNGFWVPGDKQSIKPDDNENRTALRFAAPYTRHESLPTGAEIKGVNKHTAVICSFFAKGQCTKGNSCRFLHVKNNVNSISQYPMENIPSLNGEIQRFRGRYQLLDDSYQKPSYQKPASFAGRGLPCQNGLADYSSVIDRNKFPIFSGSGLFDNGSFSACARAPRDFLPTNSRPVGFPNHLEIGKEYGAPISFSFGGASYHLPPFPESGLENFPNKKRKFSSNHWEPSEPFRPSFNIPPSILPPSCLHDPLLTDINSSNIVDRSLHASSSSQGPEILNTLDQCTNDGPTTSGPQNREHSDNNTRACFEDENQKNVLENNCETARVDSVTSRAEVGETSGVEQNGVTSRGGKSSQHANNKRTQKQNKAGISLNAGVQDDGSQHKSASKADSYKHKSDMDSEVKLDKGALNESKATKLLRAALIDTVKDLLRPAWRGGYLSKDAHNLIVKKSVEKVLGTFQLDQVPNSVESVDQYLNLNSPKIAKLVEGYVNKYRKS